MDESQKHYIEQEKPDTKKYMLHDSINMEFKNRKY